MSDYKCTLWPSGEVLTLNGEDSLLSQLKAAGKNIKSTCGGCATCSDCSIIVKSGESNLTVQTFEELRLLGNVFHITKERLSCQAKLVGDVTIDITAHDKSTSSSKSNKSAKPSAIRLKKRETIEQEAVQNREKEQQVKPEETWFRHWEKDAEDPSKPKRLGGNKRVKPFNFADKSEDEE